MKIKFNKFERVAGLFVLVAVIGSIVSLAFVAIQKKWFESKTYYSSTFEVADGLFPGTEVQMSGLRIGAVSNVEFQEDGQVTVHFYVLESYKERVKTDSMIRTYRPFVLGDKVLDLSMGSKNAAGLVAGARIPTEKSMDLMELFSGRKLAPYFETLTSVIENVQILVEAFTKGGRTQTLINIFDKMEPLVVNLDKMSREFVYLSSQMSKEQRMKSVMSNLVTVTGEMNTFLKKSPETMADVSEILKNLNSITKDLNTILPALTAVAPDLPRASKQAIEAMNEALIVLKAMQKSFLLSGAVKDVREEERQKEQSRMPASDGPEK